MDLLAYTISVAKIKLYSEKFQPLKELPFALQCYTVSIISYYSPWIANYYEVVALNKEEKKIHSIKALLLHLMTLSLLSEIKLVRSVVSFSRTLNISEQKSSAT